MMKNIGAGLLTAGLIAMIATTGGVIDSQALGGEIRTVAQNQPPAKKHSTTELSEKDDKKTVSVAVGGKVEIQLPSNISTGYTWRVESVSSTAVKQDGAVTYVSPKGSQNGPPVVGRGGYSLIKFDVVAPGQVTIKLEYARPWDKTNPPAKTFTITLDVK